jgi:hypothetical protein
MSEKKREPGGAGCLIVIFVLLGIGAISALFGSGDSSTGSTGSSTSQQGVDWDALKERTCEQVQTSTCEHYVDLTQKYWEDNRIGEQMEAYEELYGTP